MAEIHKEFCVVSIEDWQMLCCGTPFSIGDKVKWLVHKWENVSEATGKAIEFYYESHSDKWRDLFTISGNVDEINALFCSIEPHPNPAENHNCSHHRVYRSYKSIKYADGWDKSDDGIELGSYEVALSDCIICPAKKSEVTFS